MNITDIVFKLIGHVRPIGETTTDNERFENLQALGDLIHDLVCEIDIIASRESCRHEFSRKRAGEYCNRLLDDLGIKE